MNPAFIYLLAALGVVLVLVAGYFFFTRHQTHRFAHIVVGAVYRAALSFASEYADDGLAWLKSENGIIYRHQLVAQAYDLLPGFIGPIPVGLVKAYISRERFIQLVDRAFNEMLPTANQLEIKAKFDATGA